jgi:hypothetical protein
MRRNRREGSRARSAGRALFLAAATLLAACGNSGGCGSGAPAGGATGQEASGPAAVPIPAPEAQSFDDLLTRYSLSFELPTGFSEVPVQENSRWAYQHAIRSDKAKLEIRYGVIPLDQFETEYERCLADPGCEAVPPNEMHEGIFATMVTNLDVSGELRGIGTFPLDSVREEFNAQWGGALSFDVHPEFARGYTTGLAVLIHRDDVANAVFVGLFDALEGQVEAEWDRAFHAFRYREPIGGKPVSPHSAILSGSVWSCGEEGFVQMRFGDRTWTVIHISAAMAVMGNMVPYETIYHEVDYTDPTHLAATVFKVVNMEQGDLTPEKPPTEIYQHTRNGEQLTLGKVGGEPKWECKLIGMM